MHAKPKRLTIARLKDDHDSNAFNNSKKLNLTLSLQILFPNLCHLTMSIQVSDKHLKQPILEASGQLLEIG